MYRRLKWGVFIPGDLPKHMHVEIGLEGGERISYAFASVHRLFLLTCIYTLPYLPSKLLFFV